MPPMCRPAPTAGVRGRGMWIAFSCNPLLSPDSLSVQLPCDRLLVAKQSWLSAAYGPPLKTYVSHFDPVIGM